MIRRLRLFSVRSMDTTVSAARTTEETEPFLSVTMGGNLIEVRSLDLNQSFREISAALDSIAISQFGENLRRIA